MSGDTPPPEEYEPYIVRFSSEAALADYQTCQEILLGPPRSAEGYARSGDASEWNEGQKGQPK